DMKLHQVNSKAGPCCIAAGRPTENTSRTILQKPTELTGTENSVGAEVTRRDSLPYLPVGVEVTRRFGLSPPSRPRPRFSIQISYRPPVGAEVTRRDSLPYLPVGVEVTRRVLFRTLQ